MKEGLESTVNKRIILFNYPGQSHTIYDNNKLFTLTLFYQIMDKLLFRL